MRDGKCRSSGPLGFCGCLILEGEVRVESLCVTARGFNPCAPLRVVLRPRARSGGNFPGSGSKRVRRLADVMRGSTRRTAERRRRPFWSILPPCRTVKDDVGSTGMPCGVRAHRNGSSEQDSCAIPLEFFWKRDLIKVYTSRLLRSSPMLGRYAWPLKFSIHSNVNVYCATSIFENLGLETEKRFLAVVTNSERVEGHV